MTYRILCLEEETKCAWEVGKQDGEKVYLPKKYLLFNYDELNELMKKEKDPDINSIKLTTHYSIDKR